MDRARVAIFEGNPVQREMMKAAFDKDKHKFHHKVVAEVVTKKEGIDLLEAATKRPIGIDVVILGESLSPSDKDHHVAKDIVKKIRDLHLPIAIIGISDTPFHRDEVVVQQQISTTQVYDLPGVVHTLRPYVVSGHGR